MAEAAATGSLRWLAPGADDPGLSLLGYREGMPVRGWDHLPGVAGSVAGILVAAAVLLRFLYIPVFQFLPLNEKPSTPSRDDAPKQAAFCTVGIFIHLWLGCTALRAALASEDMPPDVAAGNRLALSTSDSWRDLYNVHSVCGQFFTGYAIYITIMWLAGWEEGLDKIAHHIVFLFLAVVLAGSGAMGRLSSTAMSMEFSTVFLNSNLIFGWIKHPVAKMLHLGHGVCFVLSFVALRIIFFGRGLMMQWRDFLADGNAAPLPPALTALCIGLFTGGWLLQVYWLLPIYHKVVDTFGSGKKGKSC
eukprot:TRINITY_DN56807_c0_g1_i1.p1 TRINITY_DN56807_c0_g1~~TRINITY_DN56807_c0_g1_i1.p1  ORF type:complete len:304 (+),score=108.79 TRINITY_DN56807_c0_g1_i1:82-993(+)